MKSILILLCVFFALFLATVLLIIIGTYEYKHYIKKLANKHTLDEIEEKIKNDEDELLNAKYKGIMLTNLIEHKELWEQVRDYKKLHTNNTDQKT